MSFLNPTFAHPEMPVNKVGYRKKDYKGKISTLCAGCGHDSISAAIVQACYEMSIEPHRLAKLSGIGCSSKTPTYFLDNSHGFNSVHGRMPSIATGASLANKNLLYLGVSGDGDSASIGMGQFVHVIRRNLNMTYIVMNNGCYGLTKGQDSATADKGSINKTGKANPFQAIDMVGLALELGASFVGRSFSGDKTQLVPMLKAALSHPGFAFLDIISPCVTFNNNLGSTKSYSFVRDHMEATAKMDFVPEEEEIIAHYSEGESLNISLHGGAKIKLKKLAPHWDPRDRTSAQEILQHGRDKGEIITGLLYIDTDRPNLHGFLDTVDTPLNRMTEQECCPGDDVLNEINESFR